MYAAVKLVLTFDQFNQHFGRIAERGEIVVLEGFDYVVRPTQFGTVQLFDCNEVIQATEDVIASTWGE